MRHWFGFIWQKSPAEVSAVPPLLETSALTRLTAALNLASTGDMCARCDNRERRENVSVSSEKRQV